MEDPEQEKEKGADEFVIATEAPAGPVILQAAEPHCQTF